jgi:nucleotide-binding universal stress UspA family protein
MSIADSEADSERLAPIIRHVLHPSDFSDASRIAFVHALKTALIAKCRLTLIHETDDEKRDWSEFPGVRETLERWGLLPGGSPSEAVGHLGIDVAKVIGRGADPVEGVLRYLEEHEADLIVLATNHHGFDWLRKSVAEPIARKSREMTLFVPADGRGFISPSDGRVSLRNILIPVAETPSSHPALAGAARIVRQLECEEGGFTLLHVGEKQPVALTPRVPGWKWRRLLKKGNVIDAVLETAQKINADLIVMATDGRNGFLDALRGSHSERVLRHAPCPLLAIHEASQGAALIAKAESADWYRERQRPRFQRPSKTL